MKELKVYQHIIFFVFILTLIIIPNQIKALTAQTTLTCDKTTAKASEEINCDLSVAVSSGKLSSFQGNVSVSDNLEFVSIQKADIWTGDSASGNFHLTTNETQEGNVSIGSIKIKVKSDADNTQETISVNGILLGDENLQSISSNDLSKNISIASTNANLQSLSVSNVTLSPSFSESVTEYHGTTTASSLEISASAKDSNAKVTGTGTKQLSYGDNTITISVTAESGDKKNYTIIINREDTRSNDSTLKSLVVDNATIDFKASQTEYRNVLLPSNVSIFKVTAEANSSMAKISYSKQQLELDYDETATIYITVIAENGTSTRYEVTATRQDDRSKNNNLKSLSINDKNISLNSSGAYTFTVENDVASVNVNAATEDTKAKVEVIGGKNLKVGSNKVEVVVTAENNDIKTYTITVLRKNNDGELNNLSNNSNLKSLKVKNVTLVFKKEILEYSFEVENYITDLDITYQVEDSKATAVINEPNSLQFGINKITILVTAENGNTSTYILNVTRKEKNYEVENDANKIVSALQNKQDYDEVKITVSHNEELIIPNKVVKAIISSKKKVTYIVKDNANDTVLYSFILDGSLFDSYTGDINYGLSTTSDHQASINMALENRDNMVVNFEHDGSFPTGAMFKIKVADTLKGKNNLQLYTYDVTNNQLSLVQENISLDDSQVTISVQTVKEYILTVPKESNVVGNGSDKNDDNSSYLVYGILGFSIVALIIILIILLLKKKKGSSKKDTPVKTENINNVSNTLESNSNMNMETLNQPLSNPSDFINENPFTSVTSITPESEIIDVIDVSDVAPEMEMLLGISAMNINDYLEQNPLSDLKNSQVKEGVVIVALDSSSPLLPFGLKSGDVLLDLNGQKIMNKENLRTITSNLTKGTNITLTYYQNGQNKTINTNI